jgi:hypothetical protein
MDALQSAALSVSGNLGYSMSITAPFYRHAIIRAVTGNRPAIVWNVTDGAALDRICERLAEAERAFEILRAKGHGRPGLLLHEVAALVPDIK